MTCRTCVCVILLFLGTVVSEAKDKKLPTQGPTMLEGALAGPMQDVKEIVFANRASYADGHWYANIGYYCNDHKKKAFAGDGNGAAGRLCKLNLRTGELTVLIDAGSGCIRDPVVHYDAKRILFSWRKANTDFYHLYEINVDGTNIRQLTSDEYDDIEATYLPDGDIAFVSTRCRRWVNCWKTQVAILYRCDADGKNITQISANVEHDNTPSVLPDGRLLFTRWEYVDRSQIGYHHLWAMNPDGSGQMVYYGNQEHYPLYIDARPIPGSTKVVGIESPGHGRKNHMGKVIVLTDEFGPDAPEGKKIVKNGNFVDPYAFSEDCFIVAQGKGILLMNGKGESQLIHASDRDCHEPRPIIRKERERTIMPRSDPAKATGQLILTDVYNGRNMGGVKRGDIKKLLILESLPQPVSFSGGPDLMSWLGTFTLERVLGTVPVEEDGSASFEVPANRAVFFVALDENDMSVKRMQSFVSVVPGEVTSCVGCHENRVRTPSTPRTGALMAMKRAASRIKPFNGFPDVLDFNRDIQPVLNRNCVKCHNFKDHKGSLSLEYALGPIWSHAYYALHARLQVADGRNGYGNQPPRSIGSSASRLMNKIDGTHPSAKGHKKIKLTEKDWRTVWLWIESAAPYAGTYAALRNEDEMARGYGRLVFSRNGEALRRRCGKCHGKGELPRVPFHAPKWPDKRGITRPVARHERLVIENDPLARYSSHILVNMTAPGASPLVLAPLARKHGGWGRCGDVFADREDPDYKLILKTIEESKKGADGIPRYSTPAWKPNWQYIREMKRYGVLPSSFDIAKDDLDPFETDQRYWQTFWWMGE